MPNVIQAIRPEVNRNFPIPGFRIRTDSSPAWGEVAVATSPELLFDAAARANCNPDNFWSSRSNALFPIERGEVVYLLPPQVMARFAGRDRLYYAVATYATPDTRNPSVSRLPAGATPFIAISRTYTGEIHSILGAPGGRGRVSGAGYETAGPSVMEWGGDTAPAGEIVSVAAPSNGKAANGKAGNGQKTNGNGQPANGGDLPVAAALDYDDGFSPSLWRRPQAQALATGRQPLGRALSIVRPDYLPSNNAEAIEVMREFIHRYDRWRAGVPDTSFYPHSAICKLRMTFPDGQYVGTGFYIGPNLILTCAHNVIDHDTSQEASAILIEPGRNGSQRPFSSFTVHRSDWDYHPSYDGGFKHDLAVIRVPNPAPNGWYFELEDLAASPSSPIVVCGYAAETGDENQQKLDGDTIRGVSDDLELIQYHLQTEPGNSGSPVFYFDVYEDHVARQSVSVIRVIGVHISGYSQSLNQACRLSGAKLQWIQSVGGGVSFGLSAGNGRQGNATTPARTNGRAPRQRSEEGQYVARPHASPLGAGQTRTAPSRRPAARALTLEPVVFDAVERMRQEFVANAASANKRNCITITNAGLRRFYEEMLRNPNGSNRALGSTIHDTMAALQGYGLAGQAQVFEFLNASGSLTRGVVRPDRLRDSIENALLNQADANQMSGWYVFGLSIMDGYHSVVLALMFSGIGGPDTHFYWADQIYSGWDDVTNTLDDRITRLTQQWWDPLPPDRKARTRVTVWPLLHGGTPLTFALEDELTMEEDGVEGYEEEPELVEMTLGISRSQSCVDTCTDDFCPANPAADAGSAHFTLEEFRCRDGTAVPERFRGNVQQVMDNLEVLRSELGDVAIVINSGYRTCAYNCGLDGAATASRHLCGQAADIRVSGYTPVQVHETIERLITEGRMAQGGLGPYNTFVHYDVRGVRSRWDRRR